jgi:hypothetical protein
MRHFVDKRLAEKAVMAVLDRALRPDRHQRRCIGIAEAGVRDVVLAPQMVNARRFKCDLTGLARLSAIDGDLRRLPAFADTSLEREADAMKR